LADGWLPSFVTPQDAEAGWKTITTVASEHDREIEDEHFGVLIPYVIGEPPAALLAGLKARRPDLDDVSVLVPTGWDSLAHTIQQFVDVGASKFVVIPLAEPSSVPDWNSHLEEAATHLLPLEN
jgi:hypothetical protein